MNRRLFLNATALISGWLLAPRFARALPAQNVTTIVKKPLASTEVCVMRVDEITAESTGFTRYEHYHVLALPISVLIAPPADGFKIRTSPLDPQSLDMDAINAFLKETGLDASLKSHSHEVSFTAAELERIARGEPKVKISVLSPKGNPAHDFFFTAPASALIKINRARETRG